MDYDERSTAAPSPEIPPEAGSYRSQFATTGQAMVWFRTNYNAGFWQDSVWFLSAFLLSDVSCRNTTILIANSRLDTKSRTLQLLNNVDVAMDEAENTIAVIVTGESST